MNDNGDRGEIDRVATRVRYEWDDFEELNLIIVGAVATLTEDYPSELPALQQTVDVDALQTLLGNDSENPVQIVFRYAGVDVTITSDGDVELASATHGR